MDYTERIKAEALSLYPKLDVSTKEDTNNIYLREGFIAGTEYYKQITEIEKLEFAIKVLSEHTAASHYITSDITELEQLRDKLINELKMK